MIAPFGDFKIRKMGRRREKPFAKQFFLQIRAELVENRFHLAGSVKCVDFGKFADEFLLESFRQTSHNDDFFQLSLSLLFNRLNDGIERFLFGILNKSAGIDHDSIGTIDIVRYFE